MDEDLGGISVVEAVRGTTGGGGGLDCEGGVVGFLATGGEDRVCTGGLAGFGTTEGRAPVKGLLGFGRVAGGGGGPALLATGGGMGASGRLPGILGGAGGGGGPFDPIDGTGGAGGIGAASLLATGGEFLLGGIGATGPEAGLRAVGGEEDSSASMRMSL